MKDAVDNLRKQMLEARDAIPRNKRIEYSTIITDRICSNDMYIRSSRIMVYMNTGSEVITEGIIEDALRNGKHVYIPYIQNKTTLALRITLRHWRNRFKAGIWEKAEDGRYQPDINSVNEILSKPCGLDLIYVPAICFDSRGNRIDLKNDYFGRFLNGIKECNPLAKPVLFGLIFEALMIDKIQSPEDNIKMDYIVTEHNIYKIY